MNKIKKIAINCESVQQIGQVHLQECGQCEDVIYKRESEEIKFYGIADGQSGKKYCTIGAQESLRTVADYIETVGIPALLDKIYIDEIQYELIRKIRETIDGLCRKYKADKEAFSSTLVVLAIDLVTGNYIIIHLGDGCVIGVTQDNEVKIQSAPENGITSKYTWLTTSSNAIFHLKIYFGNIQQYKRIFLMTNGVDCICRGKNILHKGRELLCNGDFGEIRNLICNARMSDDAACIMLYQTRDNSCL